MIIVSHPTGNANVRAVLTALREKEVLAEFHTALAIPSWCPVGRRRQFPEVPNRVLRGHPFREFGRHLFSKMGASALVAHESGVFSVDAVYRSFDSAVARRLDCLSGIDAVYCYEDGALETFRSAKKLGLKCIYDLPIGYWRVARAIQEEEAELLPEWKNTMPALIDSSEKLERKDEELQLADSILVASSFTASTLESTPFDIVKPVLTPYGCIESSVIREEQENASDQNTGRLRVLFAGSLSQRKGLAYLLRAVELVGEDVELTLIGKRVAACRPLDEAVSAHRWLESVPHDEMLREMREHDVLVFPSLFEGFGLVVTEALSQGIPVIATKNTCAPDLIEDGRDGFIVPIRDAAAIAECLTALIDSRELLVEMKRAAFKKAKDFSWAAYYRQIQSVANAICSAHG